MSPRRGGGRSMSRPRQRRAVGGAQEFPRTNWRTTGVKKESRLAMARSIARVRDQSLTSTASRASRNAAANSAVFSGNEKRAPGNRRRGRGKRGRRNGRSARRHHGSRSAFSKISRICCSKRDERRSCGMVGLLSPCTVVRARALPQPRWLDRSLPRTSTIQAKGGRFHRDMRRWIGRLRERHGALPRPEWRTPAPAHAPGRAVAIPPPGTRRERRGKRPEPA